MRKLSHDEIVTRQKDNFKSPRVSLTCVLNNVRSLHNVGSIFRTADGAGIEKLWLCGCTGYPPQREISKTALGAEERVPWDHDHDTVMVVKNLKKQGYQIVLLEQTDRSVPYQEFVPQGPVCLVVGHEVTGVDDELVALCDAAVEIEMAGIKNSLNVAVAFGIVAYHLRSHLSKDVRRWKLDAGNTNV